MKHLTSLAAWLAILSIVVLVIGLAQSTRTDPMLSQPFPGKASGPSLDEIVIYFGGDIETSVEPLQ